MRKLHKRLAGPIVALVSTACVACSSAQPSPGSPDGLTSPGEVVTLAEPHETVMAAQIQGTLTEGDDDCLYIGEYVTVWPIDTERTDTGVKLGSTTIDFGDQVNAGGGYLGLDEVSGLISEDAVEDLKQCPTDKEIAVVMTLS